MPKIGSYDYPITKMQTLIKACETIVNTLKGKAEQEENLAKALGHDTTKSGGYINKISDLRKYGLLEKRGFIATKRAKEIVNPLTTKDKEKALNEAVMELALWRDLRKRLGSNTPSLEDFKLNLAELTKDRETTAKFGDTIRNLYIDAMSYNRDSGSQNTEEKGYEKSEEKINPEIKEIPKTMILLKSGETEVKLERTDANIQILISILSGMKESPENQK